MFKNLVESAQEQIMDAMHDSAQTLADNSDGLFCAYETDLERFPDQSLSVIESHYKIRGNPIAERSEDEADAIASVIDKRYADLPSVINKYGEESANSSLSNMTEALRSGSNVCVGLEHSELIDVALAQVALSNYMRRKQIAHKTGLIVSKAVDWLGVKIDGLGLPHEMAKTYLSGMGVEMQEDGTVPVRDFLSIAADNVYMTVPSTKTFADVRGMQGVGIRQFNDMVANQIQKDMSKSSLPGKVPMMLCVAMPGTTVKQLDKSKPEKLSEETRGIDGEAEVIGKISSGVTKFMWNALTFATAVRLDREPPEIMIHDRQITLKDKKDVDMFAEYLLDINKRLEPGKIFVYDRDGDLPVIRKAKKPTLKSVE